MGVAGEYRGSGKTRAEFSRERGLALTTLDYYLRREREQHKQKLVPVKVIAEGKSTGSGFTVVVGRNRRVEMAADFDEAGLGRLVAVLERS